MRFAGTSVPDYCLENRCNNHISRLPLRIARLIICDIAVATLQSRSERQQSLGVKYQAIVQCVYFGLSLCSAFAAYPG